MHAAPYVEFVGIAGTQILVLQIGSHHPGKLVTAQRSICIARSRRESHRSFCAEVLEMHCISHDMLVRRPSFGDEAPCANAKGPRVDRTTKVTWVRRAKPHRHRTQPLYATAMRPMAGKASYHGLESPKISTPLAELFPGYICWNHRGRCVAHRISAIRVLLVTGMQGRGFGVAGGYFVALNRHAVGSR